MVFEKIKDIVSHYSVTYEKEGYHNQVVRMGGAAKSLTRIPHQPQDYYILQLDDGLGDFPVFLKKEQAQDLHFKQGEIITLDLILRKDKDIVSLFCKGKVHPS